MEQKEYLQKRDLILSTYSVNDILQKHEGLAGKFNIASASLSNYLPGIGHEEHESIFKEILAHQQLSLLEQSYFPAIDYVTVEGYVKEIPDALRRGPAIICASHTGSYRLVNLFLLKHRVPYSLVVSGEVVSRQGTVFRSLHQDLPPGWGNGDFHLIDASLPSAAITMLRQLRSGRSLLVYIDGNTGTGLSSAANENICAIDFLNQNLLARTGICFIAHAARVPVIPVNCRRKGLEDIRLRFHQPIHPDTATGRNDFARVATQEIYDSLASCVKKHPGQWEAWLYLYKTANIVRPYMPTTSAGGHSGLRPPVRFNHSLYGLFRLAGNFYLFNKNTYSSYPLEKDLYDYLEACVKTPAGNLPVKTATLELLYDRYVLVPP